MVLKLTSEWRFRLNTSSLTAVLRIRMFISIMLSGGVPNSVPTAVEMGPTAGAPSTRRRCAGRAHAPKHLESPAQNL
jgi:hypothetical protein